MVKIDKNKVKKILVGLQDLDASSVTNEDNTLRVDELNLLPRVVEAKEQLRSLGVDMEYLRKYFLTASIVIRI